jgi:hypothetical protein
MLYYRLIGGIAVSETGRPARNKPRTTPKLSEQRRRTKLNKATTQVLDAKKILEQYKKDKESKPFVVKRKKTSKVLDDLYKRAEIPVEEEYSNWTELDGFYNHISIYLVSAVTDINTIYSDYKDYLHLLDSKDIASMNLAVKTVIKDVEEFTGELIAIKDRHKEKSGLIKEEQDVLLSLEVFNGYVALFDKIREIVFANMITITETFDKLRVVLAKELDGEQKLEQDLETKPEVN